MLMMMPEILRSVHFTKTQKSKYLENKTLFFLQIKKFINNTSRATLLRIRIFVTDIDLKKKVFYDCQPQRLADNKQQ